jgi:hypothetical protein
MAEGSAPPVVFGRGRVNRRENPELREYADSRKTALLQERQPYDSDCDQVSQYVDPQRGRFNGSGASSTTAGSNGSRKRARSRAKIINNTATICVRTASAGFCSHMTSKSRPWFQVDSPDAALNDNYDVRVWMQTITDRIRDVLAKSNFYKAMPDIYTEDIEFGSCAVLMPEDDEEVVRFHSLTYGTYALGVGENGKVDTLYREFTRSARQLKQTYGEDKLPEQVKDALANKRVDQTFTVYSLMERNPDEKPGMGPLGLQAEEYRPWREILWMDGQDGPGAKRCIKVKGYYEQPFAAGRWNPTGDDVYSSSPCLDSLGDIKGLQYLEGQGYRLVDLMAEPPLALPDTMRNSPASLAPRSKTYVSASQNQVAAGPLYQPNPNAVTVNDAKIQQAVTRIQNALFYPLFLMLASLDDRERTATEIAERRDERATVLAPTVEVITDELLDPIIVRVFRVLERRGDIPPAPPALANLPLKIEYTSILAQAMKAAGLASIERTIAFSASIVQATGDPSHFDKIDFDQAQDEFSSRVSAPATIVRSDEAVADIREGRAQQQRAQQMAAMAKPAADAAQAYKTLAETVPQEGSAAENLAAVMGGAQ